MRGEGWGRQGVAGGEEGKVWQAMDGKCAGGALGVRVVE